MDTNAIVPILPASEAVATTKISALPEIYNPLVVLLGYVHLLRGQKPDTEELVFQASELERELKSNYSYLTLEEVRIALENGVKKRFGDYYGLNVVSYIEWLDAYKKSDTRRKALEEHRVKSLPAPPPEDPILKGKKSLYLEYTFWAENKSFFWCPDPSEAYKYALDSGILKATREQKLEAAEKARKKIVEDKELELEKYRKDGEKWSYDTNLVLLNKYKEGEITDLLFNDALLRRYAKKIVLIGLFEEIKAKGIDLKSTLNIPD